MKKLYLVILMLLLGVGAHAQHRVGVQPISTVDFTDSPKFKNNPQLQAAMQATGFKQKPMAMPAREATATDEGRLCTVRCKAVWEEEKAVPGSITIYNADFGQQFYFDFDYETWERIPEIDCEIPEGRYDLLCTFFNTDITACMSYIVLEDIDVNSDTPLLVFDRSDATNYVKFESVLPNGELTRVPKLLGMLDHEPWMDIEPGNIVSLSSQSYLVHSDWGPVTSFFATGSINDEENNYNTDRVSDFLINNVSDKYSMIQIRSFVDNDDLCYMVVMSTSGIEPLTEIVNSARDYVYNEEIVVDTPNHFIYGVEEPMFEMQILATWKGENMGGLVGEREGAVPHMYTCIPKNLSDPDGFMALTTLDDCDVNFTVVFDYGDDDIETELVNFTICPLPFAFIDGKKEYINNNHSLCGDYGYQINGDDPILEYPGHERFNYSADEILMTVGNSAPINAMQNVVWRYSEELNFTNILSPCYIGRLGEVRNVDLLGLDYKILLNGEVVLSSEDEGANLDQWGFQWCFVEDQKGKFEYYFDDKNVLVDGIEGYNRTKICADWNLDDKEAPTLQMLMFRNSADDIIDRFENAADGYFEFAGGDFNCAPVGDSYYFACAPMEVKVEYAPYGSTDWAPLAIEEKPEYYFMPGFGYFYRGSLASVDKTSQNGWFDMRFTLTDESGNTQEQTISPAFQIKSLSGIPALATEATEAEYYNLQGLRIATPGSGIYLKKTGHTIEKVIIQ